ncbi:unnamed protein product [Rotaria magnacalcarata]|uniref:Sulphur transport domain-containing protein n=6 Tax=Rotaria magnacalcarata TaxID=392030 RepID=A0A814EIW9_9BILA|nr:unnamed protein product [Rotaria magnacalcarata]
MTIQSEEKNPHYKNNNTNDTSKTDLIPVTKGVHRDIRSILTDICTILYAIIFGTLFGFFMNKGTIFVAPTIRKQMLFQRFAMLKMFLAAVGASMMSAALLVLCRRNLYEKILNGYIEHNSRRGVLHYLLGGTLIGLGMVFHNLLEALAIVYSLFTCLGGILDTYFYYAFVHERISQEKFLASSLVLRRLCDVLPIPSTVCHVIVGLIFLGIAIGLEFAVPWKSDLNPDLLSKGTVNPDDATGHFLGLAAWPPSACGAGVGLLQLFFMYFPKKSLRASSAFTVFAAQVCRIKIIGQAIPSLNSFTYGLKNYVALLFALGAIGGSAISAGLSKTIPLGPENGTNILNSILGGFILLLGARCAGGCTSGQGISGTTHLLIGSFITTASIFGGGIIFAFSYSLSNSEWLFQNL